MNTGRRIVCSCMAALILMGGYLAEGGHLVVLIQPVVLLGLLPGLWLFLAGKYGFGATFKGLFGAMEMPDTFVEDAIFIEASLGAMIFFSGLLISMGKLTQGKEVIGHSIAAALTALFYALLVCVYLSTLKRKHSPSVTNLLGKTASAITASLLGLYVFMLIMWLLS